MAETDNNKQEEKVKTSEIVIVSLILFVIGLLTSGVTAVLGFVIGIVVLIHNLYTKGTRARCIRAIYIVGVSAVVIFLFCLLVITRPYMRDLSFRKFCRGNLTELGKAMSVYSNRYNGQYPPPDRWCDLLVEEAYVYGSIFYCFAENERNYSATFNPNVEPNSPWWSTVLYIDPNGKYNYIMRSYYAFNPNCKPNSPKDVVLLFETRGGWNQFGGAEILTTEHHREDGCNILVNDGHVEFVKKKDIPNLNWGEKKDK